MTEEEKADFGIDVPTPPDILIDEHLQIWVKGRKVSEAGLQKVLLAWKDMPAQVHPRYETGELYVYIDAPPIMVGEPESRLGRLVTRLRSFTTKNKIYLFVSGFRVEGQ